MAQPAQQQTMDEALMGAITAHEEGQHAPSTETEPEPQQEVEAQSAEAPEESEEIQQEAQPDEASEEQEEPKAVPAAQAKPSKPNASTGKAAKEAKQAPKGTTSAPSSWPADLRDQFHALPRRVKDQILKEKGEYVRREAEYSRFVQAAKQREEAVKPLTEALAPFMPHLEAVGVAPAAALRNLFQTEYALRTGSEAQRAAILGNLMGTYGVSPAALVAVLEGKSAPTQQEAPPQRQAPQIPKDPRLDALLTNLQRQAKARQESQEQEDEVALRQFVESGKAEFFEDVHKDMIRLDKAARLEGKALSWEELYETACYMNPSVRTVLKKREADEAAALRAQKAQQARRAASSVRTEPGAPRGARALSLEEAMKRDIEAAFGPQQ